MEEDFPFAAIDKRCGMAVLGPWMVEHEKKRTLERARALNAMEDAEASGDREKIAEARNRFVALAGEARALALVAEIRKRVDGCSPEAAAELMKSAATMREWRANGGRAHAYPDVGE